MLSSQRKLGQGSAHRFLGCSPPTLSTFIGLLLLASAPAFARDPQPSKQIPLTPLGYQPMLPEFLASGSSLMSVHFVGKDHLLVTFGIRKLIKREVDDPPDDYDRMIGAFYIEISSGKVLARAEWRLHDRGQYLWELGDGRFLLRVRDKLSLLQPLRAERPEDALEQQPFVDLDRRIVAITASPEHDLLTIESADRQQVVLGDTGTASTTRTPVLISFYRMLDDGGKLAISSAGTLRAPVPLAIPVNSTGYLDAVEDKRDRWLFRFNSAADQKHDLAAFDTSCTPQPVFVSRSEFIAFGCLGSVDKQAIAGFSLNGDFMWQQGFSDSYVAPSFEFAPDAGRFVIGRTLLASGASGVAELSPSAIAGQEIRVYQTYNGKVLLRLSCVPAVKAGQNFALSPDGMKLAVFRETQVQHKATETTDPYVSREATVDLFDVPAPTPNDKAAVAEARHFPLPGEGSKVVFAAQNQSGGAAPDGSDAIQDPAPSLAQSTPAKPADVSLHQAAASPTATQVGDVQPAGPRQPPTLYAPGEHPDTNSPEK